MREGVGFNGGLSGGRAGDGEMRSGARRRTCDVMAHVYEGRGCGKS